jgi:hypothetical protein
MELHLAEKKYQEESKLWHPEPPACTKLLHAMLHWENNRAPTPPHAGSKPVWETSGRPTGEQQASCGIPSANHGIKQHSSLDRLTPLPHKKQKQKQKKTHWIINKEHATEGAVSAPEKGVGARSWSLPELSITKDWKGRRAYNGWVISRCLK